MCVPNLVKYVPAWLPGAEFKRKARVWYKDVQDFYEKPHAFVKHQLVSSSNSLSEVALFLFYLNIGVWESSALFYLETIRGRHC